MTLTVCWSGSITPQNTSEQRHTELEVIPRLAQTWMDALGNLPPLQQRKDKRQRQTKAAQTDESEEEDEEEDEQKLGVLWDRSHLRGSTSSVTSAPLQAYADREKSCARGDETQEIPTGFTRPRPERRQMGVIFRSVGSGFENLGISITTRSRLISIFCL